ncbi:MAG TPA: MFS transporter [Thermoplasmata archaeon]|jgi:MFS family permease|nr:MFS transporter [Thermoplasmata archaeon]HYB78727.1 MFS transporter [Thermoplasmata archaeon]
MEYKWTVLSNTTLGALVASINGTIILISLPVIFTGLKVNPFLPGNITLLIWLLLGYGVVTATLLVTFGRISDMWGRARMYNAGFAIFAVGSVLLFLTPNSGTTGAWELVGFRVIQGIGGAFLFANSAALITDAFPHSERGKALGINQVAAMGGSVVGLVLGGVLAGIGDVHLGALVIPSWRVIFLASVPVAIGGTIWAYVKLHDIVPVRAGQKIDYLGNVTFGVGLTLLLVAVTYGLLPYGNQTMGWSSPWVWSGIGIGLALLIAFLFIETRVKDPMFRLELFRIRAFAAGNAAGMLGSIARGGVMFMMIIWFQGIWLPLHGYSFSQTPFWAGIYMMPMMGGFVLMGPLSGWISDRFGARYLASGGMAVAAVTFVAMLGLPYNFVYWQMGFLLFLQGCGMGMFAAPNTAAIMNAVPPEHRGAASGMRATLQNAGMQLSMAVFFTIVLVGLSTGLAGSVHSALLSAGVPEPYLSQFTNLVGSNPTGALFGAFLGQNPMTAFITYLPPQLQAQLGPTLLSRQFFPNAVAPSFLHGIDLAFGISAVLTGFAAVVSLLRGGRYVHELDAEAAAQKPAAPAAPSPAAADPAPTVAAVRPEPTGELTHVAPAGPTRLR